MKKSNRLDSKQKEKGGLKKYVIAVIIAAAMLVGTIVNVNAAGFDDYDPPPALNVDWSGLQSYLSDYRYRAILFGGRKNSGEFSEQGHDTRMYIIYSKVPTTDAITFQYIESKGSNSGYIRATIDWEKLYGEESDTRIFYHGWTGIDFDDFESVPAYNFTSYGKPSSSNIYFDFWYECEPHSGGGSHLTVRGLSGVDYVPYSYILRCSSGGSPNSSNGTGSKPGSSSGSGGSSGGGTSSGGGNSSGGGMSSRPDLSQPDWPEYPDNPDWEDGSRPWEESNPGLYPWEDDRNTPDFNMDIPGEPYVNHGEDGHGEKGDTWQLPQWDGNIDMPFDSDDINIPSNLMPDISGMNPNYPLFEGPNDWSWPPTVLPGAIPSAPDKPWGDNVSGFDFKQWYRDYITNHK